MNQSAKQTPLDSKPTMKECTKCHNIKPISEFRWRRRTGKKDYFTSCCRDCEREYKRAYKRLHRTSSRPPYKRGGGTREYDREKVYARDHTERALMMRRAREKKYRTLYPERDRVRTIVIKALRGGIIQKQPCLVCGTYEVQAHHEDYSKPLDVIWLCRKHHSDLHVLLRHHKRRLARLTHG